VGYARGGVPDEIVAEEHLGVCVPDDEPTQLARLVVRLRHQSSVEG
jgi:hypothetical protein